MSEAFILVLIAVTAVVPFSISLLLCLKKGPGVWLLLLAALFCILVFCSYATLGTIGIDPLRAYAWAMFFTLPALFGTLVGGVLGLLIRRRKTLRLK